MLIALESAEWAVVGRAVACGPGYLGPRGVFWEIEIFFFDIWTQPHSGLVAATFGRAGTWPRHGLGCFLKQPRPGPGMVAAKSSHVQLLTRPALARPTFQTPHTSNSSESHVQLWTAVRGSSAGSGRPMAAYLPPRSLARFGFWFVTLSTVMNLVRQNSFPKLSNFT